MSIILIIFLFYSNPRDTSKPSLHVRDSRHSPAHPCLLSSRPLAQAYLHAPKPSCIVLIFRETWELDSASIVTPMPVTIPNTCTPHTSPPGSTTSQSYYCKYCCTVCNHQTIPLSKALPAAPLALEKARGSTRGSLSGRASG